MTEPWLSKVRITFFCSILSCRAVCRAPMFYSLLNNFMYIMFIFFCRQHPVNMETIGFFLRYRF